MDYGLIKDWQSRGVRSYRGMVLHELDAAEGARAQRAELT